MIKLVIRLIILSVTKVVLQIVLIIIFGRITIDSFNSLPVEKILAFYDLIILIKSVVNKSKIEYYYNIFLEKGSYKDKSDTRHFKMNVRIL